MISPAKFTLAKEKPKNRKLRRNSKNQEELLSSKEVKVTAGAPNISSFYCDEEISTGYFPKAKRRRSYTYKQKQIFGDY